jgi:hypothetical protein
VGGDGETREIGENKILTYYVFFLNILSFPPTPYSLLPKIKNPSSKHEKGLLVFRQWREPSELENITLY